LITEGETRVWVASLKDPPRNKGPGKSKVPVFYNPAMEFSRDLSILVLEEFLKSKSQVLESGGKVSILDGLAGSGIRGVRFGNEVQNSNTERVRIVINDYNPFSFDVIKKNIQENDLKNVTATNSNLNELLVKNKFDYIDIDPFGPPIQFLGSGTRMLHTGGILAVTATDTAALFGRYQKTCLRKYDAWSCRTGFSHELGLRILIGTCVRIAAQHNLALRPILVHATDYYYRVYLHGIRGRGKTDLVLKELGYVVQTKASNEYKILYRKDMQSKLGPTLKKISESASSLNNNLAGPLWTGQLYDLNYLEQLNIGSHKFGSDKQLTKMLSLWGEEAAGPLGFYDLNLLGREFSISVPPIANVMKKLQDSGYFVSRTHFCPNAIKTDAPFEMIKQLFKNLKN
jgi:tRNA (guanine26-N2/guanine27-N2)-dimethyltransferase